MATRNIISEYLEARGWVRFGDDKWGCPYDDFVYPELDAAGMVLEDDVYRADRHVIERVIQVLEETGVWSPADSEADD